MSGCYVFVSSIEERHFKAFQILESGHFCVARHTVWLAKVALHKL